MFAVCSKKESKTDAPSLKEVRDKMFEKKFGAKANRYLADLLRVQINVAAVCGESVCTSAAML